MAVFFSPLTLGLAQEVAGNSCVACHKEDIWEEAQKSVHSQNNILCQDCHGGDPTQTDQALAKASGTGYIGIPDKKQLVMICGDCHADVEKMNSYGIRTDQLARYKTSVHGKKLLLEGDKRVAACTDCHSYHDVVGISDTNSPVYPLNLPKTCNKCHGNKEIMSSYGLPTDIFDTYSKSVHGQALFEKKDLSVANCASCHGGHGAVPPGVKDLGATCGKCHINEKKYFAESVHAKITDQKKFSECISCHSNHGVKPASTDLYKESCLKCHDENSSAAQHGQQLLTLLRTAQERLKETQALVKQAAIEGIFVEEEQASLEEAKSNVLTMSPIQHTLSIEKISDLSKQSDVVFEEIKTSIDKKRQSIKHRKISLIPIWIFVLIMMAALWARYKELKTSHNKEKDENK